MARTCPHCQKPLPEFRPGSRETCPACGKDAAATKPLAGDVSSRTVVRSVEEDHTILSQKPADRKPRVLEMTLKDAVSPAGPAAPAGPKDPLIGKTMGNSEVLSVLGKGAMGVVYKARQVALDRIVAVKTIRPEFCTDEQLLERFQREAKTVGRFNTTYVVQVYDVGFAEGQHYIVMEFVPGGSLKSYTQSRPSKRLTVAEAVRFMKHSAEGLLEAERLNIIHRDIKPENLLLDQQGRVKITDFGIAKMLGATIELTGSMGLVGTPLYMSPEQCRGEELSAKSDMYSLGATFYHMLTGTPPCKGESVFDLIQTKTRIERLSPRRDLADGSVPDQLSHVIERLTALKPKDRYGSFSEVLEDLSHIPVVDEGPQGVETRPTPRRRKKSPVGVLLGFGVLLAAAGGSAWYALQPEVVESRPSLVVGPGSGSKAVVPGGNGPNSRPESGKTPAPVDPPGPDPAKVRAEFLVKLDAALPPLRETLATKGPVESARLELSQLLTDAGNVPGLEQKRIEEVQGLVNDFRETDQRQLKLSIVRDPELAPPFANLGEHLDYLEKQGGPLPAGGPEHKKWLEAQLATRREAIRVVCLGAVDKALVNAKTISEDVKTATRTDKELEAVLTQLTESAGVLQARLPEGKADWTRLLSKEALDSLGKPLGGRDASLSKVRTLGGNVKKLEETTAEFKSTRDWAKSGAAWVKDLETAEADLKALTGQPGITGTDLAPSREQLDKLRTTATKWQAHAAKVAALRGDFANRSHPKIAADLAEARKSGLADADVDVLATAWTAIQAAGRLVREDLKLTEAQTELANATKCLKGVEVSSAWTDECTERLQKLVDATRGRMARVFRGKVAVVDIVEKTLPVVDVEAFFIDQTECTVGEFKRFFAACQQQPKDAEGWYETAAAFQRYGQSKPPYLNRQDPSVQEQWPVVEVTWHQARALLRWQHPQKTLPTRAEWWLAAKGPAVGGVHREFPWGPAKDPGSHDLWANAKRNPCVVDENGLRLQTGDDDPIHHLAGNVAEWILDPVPGDAARARVIGGDYEMPLEARPREYFAGRRTLLQGKNDPEHLIGFRGVLHPGDVLGNLLP